MGLRVNLEGVEGGGFDPIPASRYPLNIFEGEVRESGENAKHPGSQYIAWHFTVAGGEFEDRHIWDNTIIAHDGVDADGNEFGCDCGNTDEIAKFNKGLFKIKNLLKASGNWTDEELNSDEFDFEISDLEGGQVAAQVGIRRSTEYGDANVIKKYMPIGDMQLADSSMLP